MKKRLENELIRNIKKLSQLREKPEGLAWDIKRNLVDLRSFTKKHITGLLKGKHNVSQSSANL